MRVTQKKPADIISVGFFEKKRYLLSLNRFHQNAIVTAAVPE
ncbi:MAG: hypothetical protein Q4C96_02660 [Planctomycetia bacterium]|nr:hypothetical protein [Planctomycetia bacterium]